MKCLIYPLPSILTLGAPKLRCMQLMGQSVLWKKTRICTIPKLQIPTVAIQYKDGHMTTDHSFLL